MTRVEQAHWFHYSDLTIGQGLNSRLRKDDIACIHTRRELANPLSWFNSTNSIRPGQKMKSFDDSQLSWRNASQIHDGFFEYECATQPSDSRNLAPLGFRSDTDSDLRTRKKNECSRLHLHFHANVFVPET